MAASINDSTILPIDDLPARWLKTSAIASSHAYFAVAIVLLLIDGILAMPPALHIAVASGFVLVICIMALQVVLALPGNKLGFAHWRIGPWYLAWACLAYGFSSLTWMAPQDNIAVEILPKSIAQALTVFGFAIFAWTCGYVIGPSHFLYIFADNAITRICGPASVSLRTSPALPWLLYGAGNLARVVLAVSNGRIGYLGDASQSVSSANGYTQVLSSVSSMSTFAISVAAWRVLVERRRDSRSTLVLLLMLEFVVGAALGMKENFVVAGLAVLVPYGVARGKLPIRPIAVLAMAFFLLVIPFNAAYRDALRNHGSSLSTTDAIKMVPNTFGAITSPKSWSDTLSTSYDSFLSRTRLIDNVALIVQKSPAAIPYEPASDFIRAPLLGFVPRSVWPDKPVMVPGYEFSVKYYGRSDSVYTSSAVTNVGDLYMHGGWVTVLIGAFLIGFGYRLFDYLFRPDRGVRSLFFVLAFLPLLVKSETDVLGMLVAIPATAFTAAIGARVACRVPRSAGLAKREDQYRSGSRTG